MSFKLHVAFSGLLHFVPNKDEGRAVRLCVVLPNAPNHNARISALASGRLYRNGEPVNEEISFDNLRVSLRVTKTAGVANPGPLDYEGPMLKGPVKGLIPFKTIAGARANTTNPAVVSGSASAAAGVRAQILIEEGKFALDMPNGAAKLKLPNGKPIDLAPKTFFTIDDVESAQLVTSPLANLPGQETAYDISQDGGGEAGILLNYLCPPSQGVTAVPVGGTPDDDFRFHYRLLADQLVTEAIDPVPTLISLPPQAQAAAMATIGPFKGMAAESKIDGGFTLLSLSAGGCNCAGASANPLAFDLDAFVGKAIPAAAVMSSLTSSPASPVPPS